MEIMSLLPMIMAIMVQDDVFEDSVVQYFHQADSNGDGEVDDDEFRNVS